MVKMRLKELLNERDESIYWLSENTSLTYTGFYKIVNGRTQGIHFDTLDEIMDALEIEDFNLLFEKVKN